MNSFFDLDRPSKLKMDDYIDAIASESDRMLVGAVMSTAASIVSEVLAGMFPSPEFPIIQVLDSPELQADAMEGMIVISTGLIKKCLELPTVPLDRIVQPAPGDNTLTIIQGLSLVWTIVHEFHHGLRRHNLAVEQTGSEARHLRAIEMDADLCAVAAVYRHIQRNWKGIYSDLTIRQIVLAHLLWELRHFPGIEESQSHPGWFERFWYLQLKLIQVHETPGGFGDPSLRDPAQRARMPAISLVALRTEILFKEANPQDPHDYLQFMRRYGAASGWEKMNASWDDVKGFVSVASGMWA